MTKIDFRGTYEGLECPGCGNGNLHHGEVTVFARGEDAEQTIVTVANGDYNKQTSVAVTDGKGNPSSRRDGLTISFTCEHCSTNPVLEISQHKGSTFIEWREGE